MAERETFVANANVVDVLSANPGLRLDQTQLADLIGGRLTLTPAGAQRKGCITYMRFFRNSNDLDFITVTAGGTSTSWSSRQITNLGDFQECLKEAALAGIEVSWCVNSSTKKMNMLNLYPCDPCTCRQKPAVATAGSVTTGSLSGV